jgi:hypothetical protein
LKGTRLWQAPGSPIIQGRSRTERPFWEGWISGALLAEAIVAGVAALVAFRVPGTSLETAVGPGFWQVLLAAIPGCLAGAALGTWLSRSMGWRRPLLAGALAGALIAGITIALF